MYSKARVLVGIGHTIDNGNRMKKTTLIISIIGIIIAFAGCSSGAQPVKDNFSRNGDLSAEINFSRRTPFVPLDSPVLLAGKDANYLRDDDLVLGLEWENVTHAYPVRMLKFHHIVNDTIAGRPFLITY